MKYKSIWTDRWGYSSVGRAPALQAGGQGFESLYLHGDHFHSRPEGNLLFENYHLGRNSQYGIPLERFMRFAGI